MPTTTNAQVLPLFGPPYVRVTDCPASIELDDAVSVTGTSVNVADIGGEVIVELLAVA